MSKKKIIIALVTIVILIAGSFGYTVYNKVYYSNTSKSGFVFIKTNATLDNLTKEIAPFLKNEDSFIWTANKKKFRTPKAGKYQITENMTNNDLVNLFRSGKQTPIKLAFNNQGTLESLAKRIGEQIEASPTELFKAFTDKDFLNQIEFTEKESLGIYIPNSYQFYWNSSAKQFRNKMYEEYQKFWNKSRLKKAKAQNLSPKQVMTLASIVHKETARNEERPIVAGLYLNRYKDKWPLQADPTIIFAMKQKYGQDFEMRRVLFKNIEDIKDSPYNTYKTKNLPPSLIAMPDISAIDAVLNPAKHEYYFMCASVSKIGYHEFAKTLAQHNLNRKKFIAKKNKQGVMQ
ncbi:MAG: endolytic transglycosylase MltG [Flavobacteriaceae bacterium]|nr:endolytic transglycosylase MltG [Flavobacteriaceae bacterium]